ncbi:MAG: cyclic pyranopterin monophosphate synthase MoaC [Lysobacterales bacterium]|jgi:molybdenum cofactor biosynthesis protein MoaC
MSESTTRGYSMADIAGKKASHRVALASGRITVGPAAFELLKNKALPKGDALALAEFAGIQAAKQTPSLIPLCHPVSLNRAAIYPRLREEHHAVDIYAVTEIDAKTGVEMEALCAVNIALLTVWDLAKPINAALAISDIRLEYKSGGKRGTWVNPGGLSTDAESILAEFAGG